MKPIQGQQQQVPCLFFLGDSQFDNGNNNLLLTSAKANYPPYGIDYPDGATGRFSNGRNIADFLGFAEPVPAFATARGSDIIKGVNYASGAAGILEESGIQLGDRISLDRQLLNHRLTIARLSLLLSKQSSSVNDYLSKCLYAVNMGSNDYINNYLMPQFYPSSRLYTPDRFAEILIQKFSGQLRTLYNTGVRKVAVFGIGLLGCLPQELGMYPTNGSPCVDFINNYVQLFNNRLKPLIDNLNSNLPNAQFIYINITSISSGDPSVIGIRVGNAPCCVVSRRTGQCAPNQVPCSNRNEYAFWDNFHPTEILNLGTASRAYNATVPSDAYPVDIRRLVQQQN
ncbi:UNVERIFIED_CONTAM: GDSL esterase/lipase [Sesamum indicum]